MRKLKDYPSTQSSRVEEGSCLEVLPMEIKTQGVERDDVGQRTALGLRHALSRSCDSDGHVNARLQKERQELKVAYDSASPQPEKCQPLPSKKASRQRPSSFKKN
jgi:hypothetical protein